MYNDKPTFSGMEVYEDKARLQEGRTRKHYA